MEANNMVTLLPVLRSWTQEATPPVVQSLEPALYPCIQGWGSSLVNGKQQRYLHRWHGCGAVVALAATASSTRKTRRPRRPVQIGDVTPQRTVPDSIPVPPYMLPGGPRSPRDGFPEHEFKNGVGDSKNVEIKSPEQIDAMRPACKLARKTLEFAGRLVKPGVTTESIDAAVHDFIVSHGAYPSPLGYLGFPKAVCTSVNDVIAHGIPDSRRLEDGDIVNIDVTVYLNGYHGDTSSMFFAGRPSRQAELLCETTRRAMNAGIRVCGPGKDFRDIGRAITDGIEGTSFYCPTIMTGHGIGSYFHGKPEVIPFLNNVDQGLMQPGMTFTIEPVLVENNDNTHMLREDGWTIQTRKGNWTAQFEHTILITEKGFEVLTGPSVDYRGIAREQLGLPPKTPKRKTKA